VAGASRSCTTWTYRFRSEASNHALQRTEAGGGIVSAYHVLLRQPLSLSLDSLDVRRHDVTR
jgi:hypothetical protein